MPRDPDLLNHPPPGGPTPDPLAAALARLEPAPAKIDRDRLMYRAGAESRRGVVRLWQATAGFLAAVGFFAGMYYRPFSAADRPAAPVTQPTGSQAPAGPDLHPPTNR